MTKISKLSHALWPVSAIPAMDTNDNTPEQDSARKRPEHQALAAEFSRSIPPRPAVVAPPETKATISDEARVLLAAEQAGAVITRYGPVHPAIAAYMPTKK